MSKYYFLESTNTFICRHFFLHSTSSDLQKQKSEFKPVFRVSLLVSKNLRRMSFWAAFLRKLNGSNLFCWSKLTLNLRMKNTRIVGWSWRALYLRDHVLCRIDRPVISSSVAVPSPPGLPDPFAKIVVDGSGQCHSTDTVKSTLDPKWNQHYDLWVGYPTRHLGVRGEAGSSL